MEIEKINIKILDIKIFWKFDIEDHLDLIEQNSVLALTGSAAPSKSTSGAGAAPFFLIPGLALLGDSAAGAEEEDVLMLTFSLLPLDLDPLALD